MSFLGKFTIDVSQLDLDGKLALKEFLNTMGKIVRESTMPEAEHVALVKKYYGIFKNKHDYDLLDHAENQHLAEWLRATQQ